MANPLPVDLIQRPPTLRGLTWLVLGPPDSLADTEKACLARVCAAGPHLQVAVQLARELAEMIRYRQAGKLDRWLDAAAGSGISRLCRLAAGLRQGVAPVRAALSLPWSNGPTEGHINRLKCVKRQMYGRAKLDLLSQRLLAT